MFKAYLRYLKDNPNRYWFRARLYGWGWVPARWQGWAVVGGYIFALALLSLTVDQGAPPREVAFMFLLPVAVLTATLIRICYKTGEKPHWQWGPPEKYRDAEVSAAVPAPRASTQVKLV